jgi:hypothetical protein
VVYLAFFGIFMLLQMSVSKILAHIHRRLWYFKTTKILQKWLQTWFILLYLVVVWNVLVKSIWTHSAYNFDIFRRAVGPKWRNLFEFVETWQDFGLPSRRFRCQSSTRGYKTKTGSFSEIWWCLVSHRSRYIQYLLTPTFFKTKLLIQLAIRNTYF